MLSSPLLKKKENIFLVVQFHRKHGRVSSRVVLITFFFLLFSKRATSYLGVVKVTRTRGR